LDLTYSAQPPPDVPEPVMPPPGTGKLICADAPVHGAMIAPATAAAAAQRRTGKEMESIVILVISGLSPEWWMPVLAAGAPRRCDGGHKFGLSGGSNPSLSSDKTLVANWGGTVPHARTSLRARAFTRVCDALCGRAIAFGCGLRSASC